MKINELKKKLTVERGQLVAKAGSRLNSAESFFLAAADLYEAGNPAAWPGGEAPKSIMSAIDGLIEASSSNSVSSAPGSFFRLSALYNTSENNQEAVGSHVIFSDLPANTIITKITIDNISSFNQYGSSSANHSIMFGNKQLFGSLTGAPSGLVFTYDPAARQSAITSVFMEVIEEPIYGICRIWIDCLVGGI